MNVLIVMGQIITCTCKIVVLLLFLLNIGITNYFLLSHFRMWTVFFTLFFLIAEIPIIWHCVRLSNTDSDCFNVSSFLLAVDTKEKRDHPMKSNTQNLIDMQVKTVADVIASEVLCANCTQSNSSKKLHAYFNITVSLIVDLDFFL